MKKLITLLLLVAATTLAFGAEKIEFDLFGCTLGTPKEKVQKALSDHNLVLLGSLSEDCDVYFGLVKLFDMEWKGVKTTYLLDSLSMVEVFDSCDVEHLSEHKQVTHKIQSMCIGMQDALEMPIIQLFFEQALKQDSTEIYARYDGHWVLMCFEKKEKISIVLVNYEQLFRLLAEVSKSEPNVRSQIPDYQESNRVTGVAGFKFGDTKASVEAKAKSKWGVKGGDEYSSIYYNVTIGGVKYDALTLYYRYDDTKKDNVLIAADLQKHFSIYNYEEAVESFNNIRSLYSNKYTNEHFFEDGDVKTAMYGMLTPEYQDEKIPPITITMRKSLSNGGVFFYYVTVSYYIYNVTNLYDDEI